MSITTLIMENLRAMGCKPAALDGETVKINAPIVSTQEKIIGYTIKSVSTEGEYYLINGWYKHFGFWIRKKDYINNKSRYLPVIAFKTKGSAKASLTKLLKIMPDYATDKFDLCEITESGRIYTVSGEG